jgi:hypothetical protein
MDELITQIGVGGIFAILLIDRVLKFVKDYNEANKGSAVPEAVKSSHTGPLPILNGATPNPETERRITDVHEIVTRTDEDGVPRVYVPKALGRSLEEIVVIVRELEDTSEKTMAAIQQNTKVLGQLRDVLTDLQNKPRAIDSGLHPQAQRRPA